MGVWGVLYVCVGWIIRFLIARTTKTHRLRAACGGRACGIVRNAKWTSHESLVGVLEILFVMKLFRFEGYLLATVVMVFPPC
jgi:hypothetical protein